MVKERQSLNPNDDLWYALECNGASFGRDDVVSIVAEVPGANDEMAWWWILKIRTPNWSRSKYMLFSGWCDYTGWDCRSGVEEHGYFAGALKAAQAAPESDGGRPVRDSLIGQIKGTEPFGLVTIEYRGGN